MDAAYMIVAPGMDLHAYACRVLGDENLVVHDFYDSDRIGRIVFCRGEALPAALVLAESLQATMTESVVMPYVVL